MFRRRYKGAILGGAAIGDPYWSSVVLLLHGDGANGGTTFTDSSTAARTPTAVRGSPTTVTDGAAFGGSSIQTAANNGLQYVQSGGFLANATDDYTLEWFVTVTAIQTPGEGYADGRYEVMRVTNGATKVATVGARDTGAWIYSTPSASVSTGQVTTNRVHMALVRTSTTVRLFIGGVLLRTDSSSTNFDTLYVGAYNPLNSTRSNSCRIEEVRLTRGVARYPGASAFTPPSQPFPDF